MRALFDTEWITMVAQEELLPAVRSAVKPMENVAVVTEGRVSSRAAFRQISIAFYCTTAA